MAEPARRPGDPLRFAPPVVEALRQGDHHIVVTGAGGWFGLATLEMLDEALGPALSTRVSAFASRPREHVLRSGRRIAIAALPDLAQLTPGTPVGIAHYAFLTREKVGPVGADDYVARNRALTAFMAAQARRLRTVATFSTSSGAVYRKDRSLDRDLAANPYGALKLEEEAAFATLREEAGTRAAICRVFNVAGPFLNKEYALGSLIRAAQNEPAITIRAQHRVIRSYAHVADIVSVGFAVMAGLVPVPDAPFDTAGLEAVEVGALALRIRALLGCPDKPILRGEVATDRDDRYVGDVATFARLAGATPMPLATLDDQILDTALYLGDHA